MQLKDALEYATRSPKWRTSTWQGTRQPSGTCNSSGSGSGSKITDGGNVREIFNCCEQARWGYQKRNRNNRASSADRGVGSAAEWEGVRGVGAQKVQHVEHNLQQTHFQFQSCQNMLQILTLTLMEKASQQQQQQHLVAPQAAVAAALASASACFGFWLN